MAKASSKARPSSSRPPHLARLDFDIAFADTLAGADALRKAFDAATIPIPLADLAWVARSLIRQIGELETLHNALGDSEHAARKGADHA